MAARLPVPGQSYVPEERISLRHGAQLRAGLTLPSVMDDGLWLTHLWVADDEGVVSALLAAPAAGPPPGTPLEALGPRIAGALSGLVAEAGGSQPGRLPKPPAQGEGRPGGGALGGELLRGFAAAVEALGRPG